MPKMLHGSLQHYETGFCNSRCITAEIFILRHNSSIMMFVLQSNNRNACLHVFYSALPNDVALRLGKS